MIHLVILRRGEKELQSSSNLQRERFHEGIQNFLFERVRKSTVALGSFSFLGRQVVVALNLLRELVTAERLLPHVDRLVIA